MLTCTCSLIVTNKNRTEHLKQVFPSLITQRGINYRLILVDFDSEDDFKAEVPEWIHRYKDIISPDLKEICFTYLKESRKFNPREAKNLGAQIAKFRCEQGFLAFSDSDVFLGMDYLHHNISKIASVDGNAFVAHRVQETRANLPRRIDKDINYGNVVCRWIDFQMIDGWDESVKHYGGDDDDLYHRLKVYGCRELNPVSRTDARQYSILHGDELRLSNFEISERQNSEKAFDKIYEKDYFHNSHCDFLNEKPVEFGNKVLYKRKN